jgi:hypothetical protein
MCRVYLSAIILLTYLSLNVGVAAGSVLCIHTDGDISFKFSSCEVCCSSCSDHSRKIFEHNAGISNEFQTGESCRPCSDIPVSAYISQFHSRAQEAIETSCVSDTSVSGLTFAPTAIERAFGCPRMFTDMNQFFSLLKTSVLLI